MMPLGWLCAYASASLGCAPAIPGGTSMSTRYVAWPLESTSKIPCASVAADAAVATPALISALTELWLQALQPVRRAVPRVVVGLRHERVRHARQLPAGDVHLGAPPVVLPDQVGHVGLGHRLSEVVADARVARARGAVAVL